MEYLRLLGTRYELDNRNYLIKSNVIYQNTMLNEHVHFICRSVPKLEFRHAGPTVYEEALNVAYKYVAQLKEEDEDAVQHGRKRELDLT